jgi:hypothetical protein
MNLTTDVKLDWMTARHYKAVTAIGHYTGAQDWTQRQLARVVRLEGVLAIVALSREAVIGYLIYQETLDSTRIMAMAVRPDQQRSGVGSLLLADPPIQNEAEIHFRWVPKEGS